MSDFTRPLTVTKHIEIKEEKFLWFKRKVRKHYWLVARSFQYFVGNESDNDIIEIFRGFKTDFASIPRIFWHILPPDGVYTQAAVLHDYLCVDPGRRTQKEIDLIFLEAMGVLEVTPWKKHTMFQAVRAYQWSLKLTKKGETYG